MRWRGALWPLMLRPMHLLSETLIATVLLVAAAPAQGQCAMQVDGATGGVRIAGDAQWRTGGRSQVAELPAGRWNVFVASHEGVRPAPLQVDAAAGGFVHVAVSAQQRRTATNDEGAMSTRKPQGASVLAERCDARAFDAAAFADVCVTAWVRIDAGNAAGSAGIACRYVDAGNHYRLVVDQKARELQLQRAMGGTLRVLQRCALPTSAIGADGSISCELQLEASGFRLVAAFDGEVLLRAFDGGLTDGVVATYCDEGVAAQFERVAIDVPAEPAATVAVVHDSRSATFVAAALHAVDCPFACMLALDRPLPLRLLDDAGFAPFALVAPSQQPFVPFGCGVIDRDGTLRASIEWPAGVALALQVAVVDCAIGTPDGSALQERLPRASLRF